MMKQDPKALVTQYYEEVVNKKNLDKIETFLAPNYMDYDPNPQQAPGSLGVRQLFSVFIAVFPDLHLKVEDLIAAGDKIVSRYVLTGTHQGAFMGMPATHHPVKITGIDMFQIAQGRIIARWGNIDELGMMQQLGVLPSG